MDDPGVQTLVTVTFTLVISREAELSLGPISLDPRLRKETQ